MDAKRARSSDNIDATLAPNFFVVVLIDVYGDTDNCSARYACWSKLSCEERKRVFRSVPSSREGIIPGCDDNHDFGEGFVDGIDHVVEGNIWKFLSDENLSTFTRENHCEVTMAYHNE